MNRTIFILLMLPQVIWANCSYEKTRKIAFSSDEVTDVITSRVVAGEDCSKGFEHITIKRANGWWLYEYYAPLRHYFRGPVTKEDILRIVEGNLAERSFSKASELPEWQEPEQYYEENTREISVTKKQYNNYREKNWLTYSHQVGYEGFKTVVFDRSKKITLEVSSGSP